MLFSLRCSGPSGKLHRVRSDGPPRGGSPWLWGWKVDLGVFLGPTLLAFALIGGARLVGFTGKMPDWGWVVFVLCVDVAHVWSTIFRTYLDPPELRRHPWLYTLVPLGCWAAGAALHARSSLLFWRVLAYVAVFHFIRQQVGWAAIYRARAGQRGQLDRWLDDAALYLGTGVPVLLWHIHLPRPFAWFVEGDFVPLPWLRAVEPAAQAALGLALLAWLAHHGRKLARGETLPWGKAVVVLTTVVSWYAGIVLAADDWAFTVLNVLPHGIPYFALLWAYGKARAQTAPATPGSRLVAAGLVPFLVTLLLLALGEEILWDRLIWHDHGWFLRFLPDLDLGDWAHLLVPLLALPQATHYVLDAFIWRRGYTGPEQAVALGFRPSPAT